ncbi:MAG: hypothetical protein ACE365_01415 [Gammaproteobacteria bacterium]
MIDNYQELFPALYTYLFDIFGADTDLFIDFLEENYVDIFNLHYINLHLDNNRDRYVKWSKDIFNKIRFESRYANDLEQSWLKNTLHILNNSDSTSENFSVNLSDSPVFLDANFQLGYIEKISRSCLDPSGYEHLTRIDMLRSALYFKRKTASNIYVVSIKELHVLFPPRRSKYYAEHYFNVFVNINFDLSKSPRWIYLSKRGNKISVYSEFVISSNEKRALLNIISDADYQIRYFGGTANFSCSSGLTALAYYNSKILSKPQCAMIFGSDYSSLLDEFVFTNISRNATYNPARFSGQMKSGAAILYRNPIASGGSTQTFFWRLMVTVSLGREGYDYHPGNIAAGLKTLESDFHPNQVREQREFHEFLNIYGLDAAMISSNFLSENNNEVILRVENSISENKIANLKKMYSTVCGGYAIAPTWINKIDNYSNDLTKLDKYAVAMLISALRMKARKPVFIITFPDAVRFDLKTKNFIVKQLKNQPYIQEICLISENNTMHDILEAVMPTLARNKFLASQGYLPPLADNYWLRAVEKWFVYLCEHPDVLDNRDEHEEFLELTQKMSLPGISKFIYFLSDLDGQNFATRMLNEESIVLNAEAHYHPDSNHIDESVVAILKEHLEQEKYFPFNAVSLAYYDGILDDGCLDLVDLLNNRRLIEIKCIYFTVMSGCLNDNILNFVVQLTRDAESKGWSTPIEIIEIESREINCSSELLNAYQLLNDIINTNRRTEVTKSLTYLNIDSDSDAINNEDKPSEFDEDEGLNEITDLDRANFDRACAKEYSIIRSTNPQLEVQQAQAVNVERRIKAERKVVKAKVSNETLPQRLVSYENIDELLEEYCEKNEIDHDSICQKLQVGLLVNETNLQALFRTWVGANPNVRAKDVISEITLEAVYKLLRHSEKFVSGIQADNLPFGFFLQRDELNNLVLCYRYELGYFSGEQNEFTIETNIHGYSERIWHGDFRQFNLSKYINAKPSMVVDNEDLFNMCLFQRLQPTLTECETQILFDEFITHMQEGEEYKSSESGLETHGDFIKRNWYLFIQLWAYSPESTIDVIVDLKEKLNNCTLESENRPLYLSLVEDSALNSREIKERNALIYRGLFIEEDHKNILSKYFNENNFKAMGQIFNQYGPLGVKAFCQRLFKLEEILGEVEFNKFYSAFLNSIHSYEVFISKKEIYAIDRLISYLNFSGHDFKSAFVDFCQKHIQKAGFEYISSLFHAFYAFVQEVDPHPDVFINFPAGNMLVLCDRVKSIYENLHGSAQIEILDNIHEYDLRHGGVYYAVIKEGFCRISPELKLNDFEHGEPTYKPTLQSYLITSNNQNDRIEESKSEDDLLIFLRCISSTPKLNDEDYAFLKEYFTEYENNLSEKWQELVLITHCDFGYLTVHDAICLINDSEIYLSNSSQSGEVSELTLVASNILVATKSKSSVSKLRIDIESLKLLKNYNWLEKLLENTPEGLTLETVTYMYNGQGSSANPTSFLNMLYKNTLTQTRSRSIIFYTAYKMAALMGICKNNQKEVLDFITTFESLNGYSRNQAVFLMEQLLSVIYEDIKDPIPTEAWKTLLETAYMFCQQETSAFEIRNECIFRLKSQFGLNFHLSILGKYREMELDELEMLPYIHNMGEHKHRIQKVLHKHVLINTNSDFSKENHIYNQTATIMSFFKQLKISSRYIDEVEPLLSVLVKIENDHYWTAEFLTQLLLSLQPEGNKPFPLNILSDLIQEECLKPTIQEHLLETFPELIKEISQKVVNSNVLKITQKTQIIKMACKEYFSNGNTLASTELLYYILDHIDFDLAPAVLNLFDAVDPSKYESRFLDIKSIINLGEDKPFKSSWTQAMSLWLERASEDKNIEVQFQRVMEECTVEKQAYLLHILAFSCLYTGLVSEHNYRYQRNLISKLITHLNVLNIDDLNAISSLYPQIPNPSGVRLFWAINKINSNKDTEEEEKGEYNTIDDFIADFNKNPTWDVRRDYRKLLKTRKQDFSRMIKETHIRERGSQRPLTLHEVTKISLAFSYLKTLESGVVRLADKKISEMTQDEIIDYLHDIQNGSGSEVDNTNLKTEKWALLFEVLGRTTGKYPHLAQQYALITNDIGINSNTRILRLSTGEGKSHFVAMRAANYALSKKIVEIFTAKDTLAMRDQKDYEAFFNYLGIFSAHVQPGTFVEDYYNTQVHYSTLGGFSLFLDECSNSNISIDTPKSDRVILFDEVDYIFFEEGLNTGYNYACHTGHTPKQMQWFYNALIDFYEDRLKDGIQNNTYRLSHETIADLLDSLELIAKKDVSHLIFLQRLIKEGPDPLVYWLQSVHIALGLRMDVDFTAKEKVIEIDGVHYPMKEIIPLSKANQPVVGSSYSDGVHQLLAVLLNRAAAEKGDNQPRNYNIHSESYLLTSQLAFERTKSLTDIWEGFSGSISATQAYQLYQEFETIVLDVPTNAQDKRQWNPPCFASTIEEYYLDIASKIEEALSVKKSILIAARNDEEVNELYEALLHNLTTDYHSSLWRYTNQDTRSNEVLLKEKHEAECWKGNERSVGIALVASCLGRGDNVGVDMVIITQPQDENDRLQKGGRTARNGAYGEVYQYYLLKALEADTERLESAIDKFEGRQELSDRLETYDMKQELEDYEYKESKQESLEHLDLLQRNFLLREKVDFYFNLKEMQYKRLKAQFSTWVMEQFSFIHENDDKQNFRLLVFRQWKELESRWNQLDKEDKTAESLYSEMKVHFSNSVAAILARLNAISEDNTYRLSELELNEYLPIEYSPRNGFNSNEHHVHESQVPILNLVSMIIDIDFIAQVDEIAEVFLQISNQPHLVIDLINECLENTSCNYFLLQLNQKLNEFQEIIYEEPDKCILHVLNELKETQPDGRNKKNAYINLRNELKDEFVSEKIDAFFVKDSGLTISEKYYSLMQLLSYLSRFESADERRDYMEHLTVLCPPSNQNGAINPKVNLALIFSLDPMPYEVFYRVWKLSQKFNIEGDRLNLLREIAIESREYKVSNVIDVLREAESIRDSLDQDECFFQILKIQKAFLEVEQYSLLLDFMDYLKEYLGEKGGQNHALILTLLETLSGNEFKEVYDFELLDHAIKLREDCGSNSIELLSLLMVIDPEDRCTYKDALINTTKLIAENNREGSSFLFRSDSALLNLSKLSKKFTESGYSVIFSQLCFELKNVCIENESVYSEQINNLVKALLGDETSIPSDNKMISKAIVHSEANRMNGNLSFKLLAEVLSIDPEIRHRNENTIFDLWDQFMTEDSENLEARFGYPPPYEVKDYEPTPYEEQSALSKARFFGSLLQNNLGIRAHSTIYNLYHADKILKMKQSFSTLKYPLTTNPFLIVRALEKIYNDALEYIRQHSRFEKRCFLFLPPKHSNQLQASMLVNTIVKLSEHTYDSFDYSTSDEVENDYKCMALKALLPLLESFPRQGTLTNAITESFVRFSLISRSDLDPINSVDWLKTNRFDRLKRGVAQELRASNECQPLTTKSPTQESESLVVDLRQAAHNYLNEFSRPSATMFSISSLFHNNHDKANELQIILDSQDHAAIYQESLLLLRSLKNNRSVLARNILEAFFTYHENLDSERFQTMVQETLNYRNGSDLDRICDVLHQLSPYTVRTDLQNDIGKNHFS